MKSYSNFKKKYVFADSSFYICFIEELKQENCYNFLDYYNFAMGNIVLNEIRQHVTKNIEDNIFVCPVKHYNYDALIAPLLTNKEKNRYKGEFEIIGLSLFYIKLNQVKYIVIDDKKAKNFAKNKFKELEKYIMGTLGLIKHCSKDNFISKNQAKTIFKDIEKAIENHDESQGNFPCSLGKGKFKKLINDCINDLERN